MWGKQLSAAAQHPRGRVVKLDVDSRALAGNGLGDPTQRGLPVYLPPGYDQESRRRYPVGFYLAGFLGTGSSQLNWRPWQETLPARLDRLQAEGAMGPVIVAFPDCFTAFGGSQYINSSHCGNYSDYLCDELVPLVDSTFRTAAGPERRAIFGKSSGGFGAIVQGMTRPDVWGAVGCHSGDSYFEFCFLPGLAKTLNELDKHGGVSDFLRFFFQRKKKSASELNAVMHLAMAACFDPQPEHPDGFELPVQLKTGRLRPTRWQRWLDWDPVRMIPRHEAALRALRCLYIDCGSRDQYYLHYGARQMRDELVKLGINHSYEEFPDNHSSIDYRLDVSLPVLVRAISDGLR